jgi:tight adherence protein B
VKIHFDMSRLETPGALAAAAIATLVIGTGALAFTAMRDPKSFTNRQLDRYTTHLRTLCSAMLLHFDVRPIIVAQALATYASVGIALMQRDARALAFVPVIALLPVLVLDAMRKRRVSQIEAQSDAFVLALSSALRSTPSVGDAFRSLGGIVTEPLRSEINLAVKHMRLGATLEEALLSMGRRINSRAFDTALTSIVIGQRLGGNLPTTLASVGGAIRELHRLDRMSKAKMTSTRTQMWIIAAAPIVLSIVMEQIQPGYFEPLMTNRYGVIAVIIAIALWGIALLLGRRILAVSI